MIALLLSLISLSAWGADCPTELIKADPWAIAKRGNAPRAVLNILKAGGSIGEELSFWYGQGNQPDDETARLVFADWLDEHGRRQEAQGMRFEAKVGNVLREDGLNLSKLERLGLGIQHISVETIEGQSHTAHPFPSSFRAANVNTVQPLRLLEALSHESCEWVRQEVWAERLRAILARWNFDGVALLIPGSRTERYYVFPIHPEAPVNRRGEFAVIPYFNPPGYRWGATNYLKDGDDAAFRLFTEAVGHDAILAQLGVAGIPMRKTALINPKDWYGNYLALLALGYEPDFSQPQYFRTLSSDETEFAFEREVLRNLAPLRWLNPGENPSSEELRKTSESIRRAYLKGILAIRVIAALDRVFIAPGTHLDGADPQPPKGVLTRKEFEHHWFGKSTLMTGDDGPSIDGHTLHHSSLGHLVRFLEKEKWRFDPEKQKWLVPR